MECLLGNIAVYYEVDGEGHAVVLHGRSLNTRLSARFTVL
jgi:hypothetical protein